MTESYSCWTDDNRRLPGQILPPSVSQYIAQISIFDSINNILIFLPVMFDALKTEH